MPKWRWTSGKRGRLPHWRALKSLRLFVACRLRSARSVQGHAFEPSPRRRRRMPLIEAALAVAACVIALMIAASTGGNDPRISSTFASAGIDCAPSPTATEQVFLKVNATDYEIIAAAWRSRACQA